MKTIGLIGGMSWESTAHYYRALNEGIRQRCGGLHSAKVLLNSVDFAPIEKCMQQGRWDEIAEILIDAGKGLENGGADFLLLCTNTMHKLADEIEAAINIPLVHIADATAEALKRNNIKTVGLLGTTFTMEEDFYRTRLKAKYGLEVLIPEKEQRETINRVIFEELCRGQLHQGSKENYLAIMETLVKCGAQGIILGCTEISMLVKQEEIDAMLYDTTEIHAALAVDLALG